MPPQSMSGLIIKLLNRVISVAACQSANSTGSSKHRELIKSAGGGVGASGCWLAGVEGLNIDNSNYLLSEPERQTVLSMMENPSKQGRSKLAAKFGV